MRVRGVGSLALLLPLVAATAAATSRTTQIPHRARAANAIHAENAHPGTTAWNGTPAPSGAIDAYASEVSARPGESIHLHVATDPAAAYRIEIYRLGWYEGKGGRRIGCVPSCNGSRQGIPRTSPGPDSGNGLLKLDWPVTDTIAVGSDWVSGYYYVNVVLAGGTAAGTSRHVPVIVLAPREQPSMILAQASVNTWQGTGFSPGATLHWLVGYEWDGVQPGCPQLPVTVFFHHERLNGMPPVEGTRWNADTVRYTAPSGARVFAGGSLQFAWGLDPSQERFDPRLDRFMRNGLDDLTRPAAPRWTATIAKTGTGVLVTVPAPRNVQVRGIVVYRHRGAAAFEPGTAGATRLSVPPLCTAFLDQPARGVFRYAVAYASPWRTSVPQLGPCRDLSAKRCGRLPTMRADAPLTT